MTNREKLRQMSDEELGKFLCSLSICGFCPLDELCESGRKGFIAWLNEEADDAFCDKGRASDG